MPSAPTCALDTGSSSPISNVQTFIIKVDKMISDHYSMIGMYVVFLIAIGFIIWYFGSSLVKRLQAYYNNKIQIQSAAPAISNNSQNVEADNNDYEGAEPEPEDVKDYMDPGKKKFIKEIDGVYKEYNNAIGEYIRSAGKTDEDGAVNADVLFSTHDDYKYDNKN